ncbi:vasopressin V1a receptor-like [Paramacrobiotus metropolitanus]|uniref:vasopressin V1a receptor-like n=1 Tax=Paramacrobiotus metropolitanus TaxID=2943436 RepID=UPI002445F8EE|nr:vasopressin V1a receptor-like [Paramacrobiotus metropolitanus]
MMMGTFNGSHPLSGVPVPLPASSPLSTEGAQMVALLSFFMVIALLGNGTVLVYLCKTTGVQRPVSIFVMALACTDILIALFSMSAEILFEAFGGEWLFGNVGCKAFTYIQGMLFGSTAFILISMSYDRYEAICRPMFLSRTRARSQRMIAASYILAAIFAIPQILIFLQVPDGTKPDGTVKYACKSKGYTAEWQRIVYLTFLATYIFLIPIVVVAVCYIKIALVVWKTSAKTSTTPSTTDTLALRRSAAATDSVERAKVKTIKLTVCILTCYIFCWLPYFTLTLFNAWTYRQYTHRIPPALGAVAKCMAWFSSCVNPIIYASFNIPLKSITEVWCGGRGDRMRLSESPRPSVLPGGATTAAASRRNTAVSVCSNNMKTATSLVMSTSPSSKLILLTTDKEEKEPEENYDPRTVLVMI